MKKTLLFTSLLFCSFLTASDNSDLDFSATEIETWRSSAGTKIQARLSGINEDGHYILLTDAGKELTVTVDQLSRDSLIRANELKKEAEVAKVTKDAEITKDAEVAKATEDKKSSSGSSSGPSFFGIAIGGGEGDDSNYESEMASYDSSGVDLTGTTWHGIQHKIKKGKKSKKGRGGQSVTISFGESSVNWNESGQDISYKRTDSGFSIHGLQTPLFVSFQSEDVMQIRAAKKGRPTTFRKVVD